MKRFNNILLTIFLLNILDAIFTWISVNSGWAYEVNFASDILLNKGMFVFFFVKIAVVSLAILYTYLRTKNKEPSSLQIKIFNLIKISMIIIVIMGLIGTLMSMIG